MRLEVEYDLETSARAGAGGTFQIERVRDADTLENLTSQVDVGLHFSGVEEAEEYLKSIFGQDAKFVENE